MLKGNPGRRPLNEDEPKPEVLLPRPPSHLSPVARREWRRAGAFLVEMGLMTNLDVAALAGYSVAYARWSDAEKALRKYGLMVKDADGLPIQSPYLAVAQLSKGLLKGLLKYRQEELITRLISYSEELRTYPVGEQGGIALQDHGVPIVVRWTPYDDVSPLSEQAWLAKGQQDLLCGPARSKQPHLEPRSCREHQATARRFPDRSALSGSGPRSGSDTQLSPCVPLRL